MTPEQKLIQIVEDARGDDSIRAHLAFKNLSATQLDQEYGNSGQNHRQILAEHERHDLLYNEARALLYRLLGRSKS